MILLVWKCIYLVIRYYLSIKNIVFLSRLLSGTYPTTSNIIPKDFNIELECKFDDLFNMIDRASLLTSDREKEYCKTYIN